LPAWLRAKHPLAQLGGVLPLRPASEAIDSTGGSIELATRCVSATGEDRTKSLAVITKTASKSQASGYLDRTDFVTANLAAQSIRLGGS
jgi:hypothetical protein